MVEAEEIEEMQRHVNRLAVCSLAMRHVLSRLLAQQAAQFPESVSFLTDLSEEIDQHMAHSPKGDLKNATFSVDEINREVDRLIKPAVTILKNSQEELARPFRRQQSG